MTAFSERAGAAVTYTIDTRTGKARAGVTPLGTGLGWPISPPVITGTPIVGETLGVSGSGWTSYQWLSRDAVIDPVHDGVLFSTARGDSFLDFWDIPVDASLTASATEVAFNSASVVALKMKLKDEAGGVYSGCFERNWKIETTWEYTASTFAAAGDAGVQAGFLADTPNFHGIRLPAHGGTAAQSLAAVINVDSTIDSSFDTGFVYAAAQQVTMSIERVGADLIATVTYPGPIARTVTKVLHANPQDSLELPRLFSTPIIEFMKANIKLVGAEVTVGIPGENWGAVCGTSITASRVATNYTEGWSQLIRADHSHRVMVCGAPSATSAMWIANLPEVLALRPSWVVFEVLANDMGTGVSVPTMQANLTTLAGLCDAAGVPFAFVNALPQNNANAPTMNTWLAGKVTSDGWNVIDGYSALVGTGTEMDVAKRYDAVHPNTVGMAALAAVAEPAIDSFGFFDLNFRAFTPISGATSATYVLTTSEANTMVSVSVGLAVGGTATSGAVGPVSPISAVAANGWQATMPVIADLAFSSVPANDQGFDATGAAITVSRDLYTTKRVRQVYPAHASFTASDVALNDYVLTTTVLLGGATHSSTLTSPKPIAAQPVPTRLVIGNTAYREIVAFHYFGKPSASGVGKQVACIRSRLTDGTNVTPWVTVDTTTISTYCEDAVPLEVYAFNYDTSGLTNNALVWSQDEVSPHIGAAASVLKSEDNYGASVDRREFTRQWFWKDTTRAAAPPYVYVSSAGNDATGVVSTTAATAAATPCLTVAGALQRAAAALGGTMGTFNGLRIRLLDSVVMGTPSFNNYGWGVGSVIIERAPGVARSAAIVTLNSNFRPYSNQFSSGTNPIAEACLTFYDCSVTVSGGYYFMGETSVPLLVQFWNCTFTPSTTATMRDKSHLAYYGVNIPTDSGGALTYNASGKIRCIRGVTAVNGNNRQIEGWATLGCSFTAMSNPAYMDASRNGHIFYNNKYINSDAAANAISFAGSVSGGDLGGIAIVGNVIERWSGSQCSLRISGDSDFGNLTHAVILHNTCPGTGTYNRWNLAYDERPAVARSHKFIRFAGNLGPQLNTKGDVHMADGTRIGNLAFHHGVGCSATYTKHFDASAADPVAGPSTLAFGQLYAGRYSVIGGGDPLYNTDLAVRGNPAAPTTGTAGSVLTLQSGSPAKNLLPAPVLGFNAAGTARGTGTQNAGAL